MCPEIVLHETHTPDKNGPGDHRVEKEIKMNDAWSTGQLCGEKDGKRIPTLLPSLGGMYPFIPRLEWRNQFYLI